MRSQLLRVVICLVGLEGIRADPTDWVNPRYAIAQSNNSPASASARQGIVSKAHSSAQGGPWSITSSNISAPSKSPHDYLSWAPYHWPECNWCSKGRKRVGSRDIGAAFCDTSDYMTPIDNGDPATRCLVGDDASIPCSCGFHATRPSDLAEGEMGLLPLLNSISLDNSTEPRDFSDMLDDGRIEVDSMLLSEQDRHPTSALEIRAPTQVPAVVPHSTLPDGVASQLPSAAHITQREAAQGSIERAKTAGLKTSCTPSPSKSMPPSATWTACPYVAHDGRVNPDVRIALRDAEAAVKMADSVLYNAVAYATSGRSESSLNAANMLYTFFVGKETMMNPNVNYGQVVRGPSSQEGAYTGILDHRGMIKVASAVMLLRAANSPHWSASLDSAVVSWVKNYTTWLQSSDIGKRARAAANNHGTFYFAQLAALQILTGDDTGAKSTLQQYYSGIFQNQITSSGEQPLEAVRTRPWHYRCFNIEAMIVNAKLGDYLGVNYWKATTKYGGTLQAAVDHMMGIDPKGEDVRELIPHLAAISAAFGDVLGRYSQYMQAHQPTYDQQPFWYYNQRAAFDQAPASHSQPRRMRVDRDPVESIQQVYGREVPGLNTCPAVLNGAAVLELDLGIFTTCEILRPFYGT